MDVWRDLSDPRRAACGGDLEANLKEPTFENLEIPEKFGPVWIVVDDHKVKRFAFEHDDYHPWFLQAGPEGERIGHAGLLSNDLVQLFTTRYRASRTVGLHTEEQMWFASPVRVGERVCLEGAYTEAYERRGQGYVVMEATATSEDGRVIVRHRGVEILRTMPGSVVGRGSAQIGKERVTGVVPEGSALVDSLGRESAVGTGMRALRKSVTQEQASVFSRAGEYVKNIHNDLEVARAGGLARPIVQGQQQYCLVCELLVKAFGYRFFRDGWLRCKFVNALDVFDEVEIGGVVTGRVAQGDDVKLDMEVWVRRSDGTLTTVGWASCRV